MIAFIHTSPAHIATFDRLLAELSPSTVALHHVDESLLADARRLGLGDQQLVDRVQQAMDAMAARGAPLIVCTCSTIGGIAEGLSGEGRFTPMRIDRAMADAAVRLGSSIAVLAALESTVAPTVALIEDSAQQHGAVVAIASLVLPGAWQHFERGETGAYHACIAAAVRELAPRHAVVVLAQASMAGATDLLDDIETPVLCSPRLGVVAALQALEMLKVRRASPAPSC